MSEVELQRARDDAVEDGGVIRLEGRLEVLEGRRRLVPVRWHLGDVALEAGEALALDPRDWPAGTRLVVVPPGWAPPVRPWYTYDEAAFMLRRSRRTLQNLVSLHKLPRTTYRDARGVYRRLVTDLPPATLRRLAELTGRAHWIVAPTRPSESLPS
jgi:hypothetical protein